MDEILGVTFELPDKKYRLGSVRYQDLLNELVLKKGTKQQRETLNKVNACKDDFQARKVNISMQETSKLLAEIFGKEKDAVDSLIMAEALYVLSRAFFYGKNTSFEPANGLLFRAMNLSAGMIHSEDSLIQITALFQLAREHDVWEGLTKRYGQFVKDLTEQECLYAASIAVKIKEEYLGLDGPPLMRSLGNLLAGYSGLQLQGRKYPEDKQKETLKKGLQIVENIGTADVHEYGELASYFLAAYTYPAIRDGKEDIARKYLTIWLQMLTGDSQYVLGAPVTRILEGQGLIKGAYAVVKRLKAYKQKFGKEELEITRKTLTEILREQTKDNYRLEESKVLNLRRFFELENRFDLQLPSRGKAGFDLFQREAATFFVQKKELLINQKISSKNEKLKIALDSILLLEDRSKQIEIALSKKASRQNYWACYEINKRLYDLKRKANKINAEYLFSYEIQPLDSIQKSLAPNELWMTILIDRDVNILAICDKNTFLIDSIHFGSSRLINELSPKKLQNHLADKISSTSDWTLEDEKALKKLAELYFKGRIPENTEHIILSFINLDRNRGNIWEVLLREYMRNSISPNFTLKSIRNSYKFLHKTEKQDSLSSEKTKLIAIAPEFKARAIELKDSEVLSLIDRMRNADELNYRNHFTPLLYNIPEVLSLGELVKGEIIVGADASEEAFLNQESQNKVLHFSTHALSDAEDAYRSGIILNGNDYGTGYGTSDNILHFHEIRKLNLNAKLVVLSACETGTGPKREEGFQWTLADAFREAGCENIISTSWKVEDRATHDIVIEFYNQLILGKGKAEALFCAKEKYIENNPGKGPHYWAPLILSGDNQIINFALK